MNVFREALSPLKLRIPRPTKEIEVLRIVGHLDSTGLLARRTVLQWVERKAGQNLPKAAWEGLDFEVLNGGRHAFATNLKTQNIEIWAIRSDDPDKDVPGRIWTTEVTIGGKIGEQPFFTVRQLMTTSEEDYQIEAAVPSFVSEIVQNNNLIVNNRLASNYPEVISNQEQMDDLADWLVNPSRRLPVFILTTAEGTTDTSDSLIDAQKLARSTAGLANTIVVPKKFTWTLTERFEQKRAVFGGAVRAYLTGFTEDADPYAHRLVVADRLQEHDSKAQCLRWMRNLAALESRRHSRLGQEVIPYTQIKSSAASLRLNDIETKGGGSADQIDALKAKIKALENEVMRVEQESTFYLDEQNKAENRAKEAEEENRSLVYQLRSQQDRLTSRAGETNQALTFPSTWNEFSRWCEDNFSGFLVLTSPARKGIKKTDFEDVPQAARCLAWLVKAARPSLLGQSGLVLSECPVEDGIKNAHCGSDAFEFDWNGRRLTADWHIKNGGNTRDPRHCLRIYYAWDDDTQQLVVAEMPAHRRTDAS